MGMMGDAAGVMASANWRNEVDIRDMVWIF